MDRGAWRATVYGFAKSRTWLSDWATQHSTFRVKNKAAPFLLFPPCCHLPQGQGCASEQSSIFMSRNKMTDVLELHVITLLSVWMTTRGFSGGPALLWATSPGCGGYRSAQVTPLPSRQASVLELQPRLCSWSRGPIVWPTPSCHVPRARSKDQRGSCFPLTVLSFSPCRRSSPGRQVCISRPGRQLCMGFRGRDGGRRERRKQETAESFQCLSKQTMSICE